MPRTKETGVLARLAAASGSLLPLSTSWSRWGGVCGLLVWPADVNVCTRRDYKTCRILPPLTKVPRDDVPNADTCWESISSRTALHLSNRHAYSVWLSHTLARRVYVSRRAMTRRYYPSSTTMCWLDRLIFAVFRLCFWCVEGVVL